jgi:ABC-type transport system involved in cytochrome c biogenesis permease component
MRRWLGLTVAELQIGLRSRGNVLAMGVLAGLALVIESLSGGALVTAAAPHDIGVWWMTLMFLGMLETAMGSMREELPVRLLLSAESRLVVYWAKFVALWIVLMWAGLILMEGTVATMPGVPHQRILLPIALGVTGMTAINTLFHAMTSSLPRAIPLLPLLVIPLELPVLICGFEATARAWLGDTSSLWIHGLIAVDVIFLMMPLLMVDVLWEV